MKQKKNIQLTGSDGRPFLLDLYLSDDPNGHLLVFCHGFKGFKDWGGWDTLGRRFVQQGLHFIKFNYSHNGTTVDQPMEFSDLDAFGRNTFSKELYDLGIVLDQAEAWRQEGAVSYDCLHLIGHSRSGPVVIIRGLDDPRVDTVTTWAAVADLKSMLNRQVLEEWKRTGVIYVANSRTGQQMPLRYDLYEDYVEHEDLFNLFKRNNTRRIPLHFIHGDEDKTVPYMAAYTLRKQFPTARVDIIAGAGHTFGCRHPQEEPLPSSALALVDVTVDGLI